MTSPRRKPNGVDAIYPLTPLQHGLLVHALEEPDKRRYVEQLACTIDGDLDVDRL